MPFVLTWVHCDDLKPWYPTKKYIPKHLNVMYELRLDKKYDMIGILRYKYFRKIFIWRTFSFKCVILSVCVAETSTRSENSSEDQDQDEDFYCVKDWTLLPTRDKIKIYISWKTWSPSSPNLTILLFLCLTFLSMLK